MMVDYGPNLSGLGQGVAADGGPGGQQLATALNARQAGTGARVQADLNTTLGPAQNPTEVGRAIADTRQAVTAPLYQQAYQDGQLWNPDLADLAQRPAISGALQDAATTAANKGAPFPTITLDANGNPVSSQAALSAYEAGTRPQVEQALATALNVDPTMGPLATQDALAAARKAASDPLYAAWRQTPVPMTPELADVLQRPSVQAAIPGAQRKAADQGRTIFAPGGGQAGSSPAWEPDPLGPQATPSLPPEQTQFAPPESAPPPVPESPGMPRPQTLQQFVRSAGGVRDPGGDLQSMGLGNLIARPGQGLGPDAMRHAAAQAGYLGADISGATANTGVNDLLDALGSENPVHSVFDQPAVDAWASRDAIMAEREGTGLYGSGGYSRPAGQPRQVPISAYGPDDFGPPSLGAVAGQASAPSLTAEGLDYVKRTLGDKIDTAIRAGSNDDARIYTGLKNSLVSAIDNHPDPNVAGAWQAARQAYAGPSALMDAAGKGYDALGNNVTREQVARDYAALNTADEQAHYRKGLFDAMRERLAQRRDGANFVDTVAGNQALRDKFAAVAPHPAALDHFNATINLARQKFTEAQRPTVEGWHGALSSLDAKAAGGDPGVIAARDALAGQMNAIPPFARARQLDQEYGGISDALAQGRTALRSGPNALHPADFEDRFAARIPPGQEAERIGIRGDLDRSVSTARNNLSALKTALQGPDGWNTAKIGTAFGDDAASALGNTVDRETTFGQSHHDIVGNSVTARRTAAKEAYQASVPQPWVPFPEHLGATHLHGMAADYLLRRPVNALARALQGPIDTAGRDLDIGRGLASPGPHFLGQVHKAHEDALTNALIEARGRNAVMYGGVAIVDPLALALMHRKNADQRRAQ